MKKQPVSIRIEKPCHEDWNAMTPVPNGRFCGSCQKVVTDFTSMTDNEVLEFLQNRTGNMCGQLRGSQLNRALVQTHLERNKWTLNTAFTAVMLAAGAGLLSAQTAPANTNTPTEIKQKYPICANPHAQTSTPAQVKHMIKAQVVDSASQEVMPFTTVIISGTSIRTTTDEQGNFELEIPDSLAGHALSLTILAPGYAAEYFTLNATEIDSLHKIEIAFEERFFKGEMIIIDNSRKIDNR